MTETQEDAAAGKPPLHAALLASLEQDKANADERIRIIGELETSMAEAETSQARTVELTTEPLKRLAQADEKE